MQISSNPRSTRELAREGKFNTQTGGMNPGYVQANLVILPVDYAFDFLLFCERNPKPCPLIEVVESGLFEPVESARGADLRSDLPSYRIYRHGVLDGEVDNISKYWRDDLVSFLIGCSFTFEAALERSGINVRHNDAGTIVPMFFTNLQTKPAGKFFGPMIVTMRPIHRDKVVRAVQVTSRFPSVHGAPIHIGDPSRLGIVDVNNPDFGDPVEIKEDEIPVFWACGVTPQAVAMSSKPPFMITHSPGHMFVTDIKDESLSVI